MGVLAGSSEDEDELSVLCRNFTTYNSHASDFE